MQKQLFNVVGEILSVSNPIHIERTRKASFTKIMVGIKTKDQQTLFVEVREIPTEEIEIGSKVSADIYFAGSVKNEKSYNNIIAKKLTINE